MKENSIKQYPGNAKDCEHCIMFLEKYNGKENYCTLLRIDGLSPWTNNCNA